MQQLTLDITGMSCGHCIGRVSKALSSVPGVTVGEVKLGSATVSYDPQQASPDQITKAVADAGYTARAA